MTGGAVEVRTITEAEVDAWSYGLEIGFLRVPAKGLGKTPGQTPPSKHAYALSSHLVYGFTTELVRSVVRLVI